MVFESRFGLVHFKMDVVSNFSSLMVVIPVSLLRVRNKVADHVGNPK